MSKRTVYTEISPLPSNIGREVVLDFLHNHLEMIDLNPLVKERHPIPPPAHASPHERHCVWYSLTDKITYLPGGLVSGDISYTAAFHDLPNGIQTHCQAPMGVDIRSKWTLNGTLPGEPPEPVEIGIGAPVTGLYIREDVELRCNVLMANFVKKTTKRAHQTLVEALGAKAKAVAGFSAAAGGAGRAPPSPPVSSSSASPLMTGQARLRGGNGSGGSFFQSFGHMYSNPSQQNRGHNQIQIQGPIQGQIQGQSQRQSSNQSYGHVYSRSEGGQGQTQSHGRYTLNDSQSKPQRYTLTDRPSPRTGYSPPPPSSHRPAMVPSPTPSWHSGPATSWEMFSPEQAAMAFRAEKTSHPLHHSHPSHPVHLTHPQSYPSPNPSNPNRPSRSPPQPPVVSTATAAAPQWQFQLPTPPQPMYSPPPTPYSGDTATPKLSPQPVAAAAAVTAAPYLSDATTLPRTFSFTPSAPATPVTPVTPVTPLTPEADTGEDTALFPNPLRIQKPRQYHQEQQQQQENPKQCPAVANTSNLNTATANMATTTTTTTTTTTKTTGLPGSPPSEMYPEMNPYADDPDYCSDYEDEMPPDSPLETPTPQAPAPVRDASSSTPAAAASAPPRPAKTPSFGAARLLEEEEHLQRRLTLDTSGRTAGDVLAAAIERQPPTPLLIPTGTRPSPRIVMVEGGGEQQQQQQQYWSRRPWSQQPLPRSPPQHPHPSSAASPASSFPPSSFSPQLHRHQELFSSHPAALRPGFMMAAQPGSAAVYPSDLR